jgi:hypothetical protein
MTGILPVGDRFVPAYAGAAVVIRRQASSRSVPCSWADHCLTPLHAVDGLIAHVMYDGVTTPFTINGAAGKHPE